MPRIIRPRFRGFGRLFPTGAQKSRPSGIAVDGDVQPVFDVGRIAAYNATEGERDQNGRNRADGYFTVTARMALAATAGGGQSTSINPLGEPTFASPTPDFVLEDPDAWAFWILAANAFANVSGGASFSDIGAWQVDIQGAYPAIFNTATQRPVVWGAGGNRADSFTDGGALQAVQQTGGTVMPNFLNTPPLPVVNFNSPGIGFSIWNTNQGGGIGTVQYDVQVLGKYLPRGVPYPT